MAALFTGVGWSQKAAANSRLEALSSGIGVHVDGAADSGLQEVTTVGLEWDNIAQRDRPLDS